jgi:tetratricopeptide (TPR) repeat protein
MRDVIVNKNAAPSSPSPKAQEPTSQATPAQSQANRTAADRAAQPTPVPSHQMRARRVTTQPLTNNQAATQEPTASAAEENEGEALMNESEAETKAKPATASEPLVNVELEDAPPAKEASKTDRIAELREQAASARTDGERLRLQRTLIDYLVALNRQPEALSELREMMRDERFDPTGFYNIGNALARLGDTDTAIDAYRKAIDQRHGNYSRALNNLGVMYLRQGRWDDAYQALVQALRQESFHYAEASYNLGRVYAARGEADLAIKEWRRTLALQPEHEEAALALARAYAEDGSPERGLAVLDAFTSRKGPNEKGSGEELTAARREIMSSAAATDETTHAATTPTRLEKTAAKPEATSSPVTRRASSARPLRSLSLDPQAYDLLQRARTAREAGRLEESVTLYRRVLAERAGFFPPANLELSFALINLRRNQEAIITLSALTSREGARYPVAFYHLGRLYENENQLNLAEQAYQEAARNSTDAAPQFLLDLSRVREKTGNLAGALDAMEAYAKLASEQGRAPEWIAARLAKLREQLAADARQTTAPKD